MDKEEYDPLEVLFLRVPRSLKARLTAEALADDQSRNQWCTAKLLAVPSAGGSDVEQEATERTEEDPAPFPPLAPVQILLRAEEAYE